jgi:hypothetical protein
MKCGLLASGSHAAYIRVKTIEDWNLLILVYDPHFVCVILCISFEKSYR